MRSLRPLAALAAVILLACPALAQPDTDEIGIYFDSFGGAQAANVPAFVPFTFYVVANPGQNIEFFELSISVPPEVIALGAVGPPVICIGPGCGPLDWAVGLGACVPAGVLQLVEVQGLFLTPGLFDLVVCVGPFEFTSFVPPAPGYLDCAGIPWPFGLVGVGPTYPPGCGIINPLSVATGTETWGSVKSRFGP